MTVYAGIGGRDIPKYIYDYMVSIGEYLSNCVLRSGHAEGSDSAFEEGCDNYGGRKEIYIPWKGFNKSDSNLYHITDEALELAAKYHPAWDKLSKWAKQLMARNCFQVLGKDLKTPCDFIVCWTKNGKMIGGTSQALRIAKDYNIPIFNLGCYNSEDEIRKALKKFFIDNGFGKSEDFIIPQLSRIS